MGAPFEISDVLSAKPRLVFGIAMTGAPLILYRVALAGLLVYLGRGLYRLNGAARKLATAYCVYSTAENIVWSVITPTPHGGFSVLRAIGSSIAAALNGLIAWYLIRQWPESESLSATARIVSK
jgi:hypothetical protein